MQKEERKEAETIIINSEYGLKAEGNSNHVNFINYLEKKFVEIANAILIALDKEGKIIHINKEGCDLLGYKKSEIIGKNWFTYFIPPDEKAKIKSLFKKILAGDIKHNKEAENYVLAKNNNKRFIHWRNAILYNKEGKIIGTASYGEDITERSQHEESQNYLAAIINSSEDAIISLTLSGEIKSWNKGAEKMYGYTAKEVIGQKADLLLPKNKVNEIDNYVASILKGTSVEPFETIRDTKSGKKLDISLSVSPVKNDDGKIIAISTIGRDITKKKDDEQMLKASRERYRRIFHNIQDIYYETSLDGVILEMSPSIEKHSGYKREELIGQPVANYYTNPNEREGFLKQLKQKGYVSDYEITLTKRDGISLVCSLTCSIITDEKGQQRIAGSFRNIDERKSAEKRIKSYANELSIISETASALNRCETLDEVYDIIGSEVAKTNKKAYILVSSTDAHGKNIYIKKTFGFKGIVDKVINIMNYDPRKHAYGLNEMTPEDIHDFTQGSLQNYTRGVYGLALGRLSKTICNTVEKLLNIGNIHTMGFSFKAVPSGGVIILCKKGEPLRNKSLIEHIIKQGSIVIERKKAEKRLRYEASINYAMARVAQELLSPFLSLENIYHTIQQFAFELTSSKQVYTGLYNQETNVLHIDSFSIFKEKQYQAIEKSFNITDDNCSDYCKSLFMPTIETKKPFINNNISQKPEKDYLPINNFLAVPVVSQNKLKGLIAVASSDNEYSKTDQDNLTNLANLFSLAIERTTSENALKNAKEKAEEADHLKSAFLANMSHEIRTPLNGIMGFSDLINKPGISKEKRKAFSKIIKENSRSLLNLINDIIDFSKIEAGQLKLNYKESNINNLINDVYSNTQMNPLFKQKENIAFHKKTALNDLDATINTDPFRVKQVLINLVNNAYKFTEEGSIELGYEKAGCFIQFFVKDTGMGIDEEQQKIIFERFRQGDDTLNREYGGAGLGLSISKALVEMLGGDIYLRSTLNQGTTFFFTIPYEKTERKENDIPENKIFSVNLTGKNILVVEDDKNTFPLIEEIINPTNAKILWAKNGQEAVKICQNNNIDLVLMDIRLPVMDGYEATRKIKAINKTLPVIAQTANAMSEQKTKALEAGCDDYIAKPYTEKEILQAIAAHIH